MLHTVVGWIVDDVPAYVIENERGKQKVIHRVQLLLWSSAEEEEGLKMTDHTASNPSLHVGTGPSTE